MKPEYEILIVRNTCVNTLYDVVKVDFYNEDVEFVAKALQYAEAVGLKLELEQTTEETKKN